jgi:divalent metal cation (Fe/Co/Zn/Cd) transporter
MTAFVRTLSELIEHLIIFVGLFLLVISYRKLTHQGIDKEDREQFVKIFGATAVVFITGDVLHFLYLLLFHR